MLTVVRSIDGENLELYDDEKAEYIELTKTQVVKRLLAGYEVSNFDAEYGSIVECYVYRSLVTKNIVMLKVLDNYGGLFFLNLRYNKDLRNNLHNRNMVYKCDGVSYDCREIPVSAKKNNYRCIETSFKNNYIRKYHHEGIDYDEFCCVVPNDRRVLSFLLDAEKNLYDLGITIRDGKISYVKVTGFS